MLTRLLLAALVAQACKPTPGPVATPGPEHQLLARPSALTEYAIYAVVLAEVVSQFHPSALLLRDSVGDFDVPGRSQIRLRLDSLHSAVPIVLLGDSIEGSHDWRSIYGGRTDASGVLRLYRPRISLDSLTAVTWLQNRCSPIMCGGLNRIALQKNASGQWTIVRTEPMLVY